MALVSLVPYIERSAEPWTPLRSTSDMAHYIDQISAVFENPSIQQIPGCTAKAIWDTRTTYDFPNNVIDEAELYPRKKRKAPRSVRSMEPDSPSAGGVFEKYHKDVWTAAPSGVKRRARDFWARSSRSSERRRAEDLRHIGLITPEVSDIPSLTDSVTVPSLSAPSPTTSTALDNLEPHILTSGIEDLESMDPVERLDMWMDGLQSSMHSSMELDYSPVHAASTPASQDPPSLSAPPKAELGPRRSHTLPVEGSSKKLRRPRHPQKRDSWPAPVVALKRPAFPRKKIQELQTITTPEQFRKSLTATEEEKRARSKRMLSLLLPLVTPKEAIQFFPLFTKREVQLLTELLQEDKKLAARLKKVGITLPLDREEILGLADKLLASKDSDAESVSSIATFDDGASSRPSMDGQSVVSQRLLEEFPPDQEVDMEINKRRETPSHLLPNAKVTHRNWCKLVDQLDPRFKYITWCKGVWTLELDSFNTMDIPNIPLYIANAPVILSYAKPTPQISGQRPPDPLRDRPLPVGTLPELSDEILSILFKTFPKAVMACVFINQRMSIVYDHDFDHGLEHMTKPETFGGYLVSFMKNNQSFTAASNPLQSERLLTGKRVDVRRPDSDSGWTSCLGVRLRRKNPSPNPAVPNDAITMTTHAFLTALRLPTAKEAESNLEYRSRPSNASLSSSDVTNDDFARLKVYDRTKKGEFGQYYQTYDDLPKLRGDIGASKFTHDLSLIRAAANAPTTSLPVLSFQHKKKAAFKKMEWCTSHEMLRAKQGKMYLLNSWTGADSKNPKDGNVVAEGLVIGEAYQNISANQKEMYARSILWRQNFTSKQWQVGQVQGLRERAYKMWHGAPVRRIRLEQHLVIQEHGYSGSPLAVRVGNDRSKKKDEESYAIFGFQNYAMRCWHGDEDDGFKKSAFGGRGGGGNSVVNRVLMEALDHGAYEFFGSYQLPKKVVEDWEIVYDVEEPVPGVTVTSAKASSSLSSVRDVDGETGSSSGMESGGAGKSTSRGVDVSDRAVERSSRRMGSLSRRRGRRQDSAGRSCVIF
ncbi:hypothetical protein Dda_1636 [Drechslerella dactyloides]|uniref:Uncharacterized protein n=1 Tax=Drechslerella dactyloides TaxID=74499 RepID=A0AAD6NLZ5_DREDA|nr:hypothetical protein Dda_1636 [Drechslerella dactyloides]